MIPKEVQYLTGPLKLSPTLYILAAEKPHRRNSNVYLINDPEQRTLIDAGSVEGFPQLENNLKQLNLEVKDIARVIATHGHFDHVSGVGEIRRRNPNVIFNIHEGDVKAVTTGDKKLTAAKNYEINGEVVDFEPLTVKRNEIIFDRQIIEAGNHFLLVQHTRGHTDGSVTLHSKIDDLKHVFTGDLVGGHATEASNLEQWGISLDDLLLYEFDNMLTGHGFYDELPLKKEHLIMARPGFNKEILRPGFNGMSDPWSIRPWSIRLNKNPGILNTEIRLPKAA